MIRLYLFIFLFLFQVSIAVYSAVPAFPGAEGHGRYATGGRGGKVLYVNTLSDNTSGNTATGEGSLRWCVSQTGTRTILFKVSGTIALSSQLSVNNGNLTIAGQSAPGDGICISGYPVSIGADNVIIRYVRIRMGDTKVTPTEADGADALGGRFHKNIIIDHCSVCWSTDECCSFYQNNDFTLQWCIISESLRLSKHEKGPHGYGGIWGGTNASFHHNLMAHHDSRNPRLGPGQNTDPHTETVDMRNNVIYDWGGNSCYGGEAMNVNIVNCYYKPGPATDSGSKRGKIISIDKSTDATNASAAKRYNIWGQFYIDGNVIGDIDADSKRATADNWTYGVYNQFASGYGTVSAEDKAAMRMSVPFDPGIVTTHTAEMAYERVMDFGGASLHRDDYDKRIIDEARNRKAAFKGLSVYNGYGSNYPGSSVNWKSTNYPRQGIIDSQTDIKPTDAAEDWSPWPTLKQEEAPADSNIDGIPDGWIETNYPGKLATDKNEEGYTLLEVYLNSLVNEISVAQNIGGVSTSSEQINLKSKTIPVFYNSIDKSLKIYAGSTVKEVNVLTITGQPVERFSTSTASPLVDLQALSMGIYIARITTVDPQFSGIIKFSTFK